MHVQARTIPVPLGRPSFLDVPRCDDLDTLEADIAIIAYPFTVPYSLEWSRQPSSLAPAAIRESTLRYASYLQHYDFDFGSELFAGRTVRIVDCGDVFEMPGCYEENSRTATAVIRRILEQGAVPFIFGGDHATTIPMMRAYEGRGPICVVHLDAHLDWRDEINGVHDGLSSPMRRASELPWVTSMIQIGLRAVGSARQRTMLKLSAASVCAPRSSTKSVLMTSCGGCLRLTATTSAWTPMRWTRRSRRGSTRWSLVASTTSRPATCSRESPRRAASSVLTSSKSPRPKICTRSPASSPFDSR
ncbi:MAG: hypothetical protein E6I75_22405 [Chloroflexi bacterium]|nr:MAG: hypothetical protein E6I75_22405 [Chloroflexota bacterium]